MTLIWLILIPLIGGLLSWFFARWSDKWSRWLSLIAVGIDLGLAYALWMGHQGEIYFIGKGSWIAEIKKDWMPGLGISFHLGMDGLSLLMVMLTAFLGIMSVAASWSEIKDRVGFFHFNLMWSLAGIIGVFLSLGLFLFYFFWELMLVPMYFLIALWGHEKRIYAAVKFFIFTQLSGLLMLASILGLYFAHGQSTGVFTFDYERLLGTAMGSTKAMFLMLGFVIAFLVKLPAVPFHTWLPDAHTEAPTAGSVILAGLLLKTGAYGLLRFVIPLFPQAASGFSNIAMVVGVIGILYGAILAFSQRDFKRLVAYTSVSHMGFVLLGVFAGNDLALQGAVVQIICHGVSTGALFIIVGALQERIHTRNLERMGGLWTVAPRMGGAGLFFALASLGLPGLGNFVGEFMVLTGTYAVNVVLAVVATAGLVAATLYSLWMMQSVFFGAGKETLRFPDLRAREMAVMLLMMAVITWIGLYPQPVINTAERTVSALQRTVVPFHVKERSGRPTTRDLDHDVK
jgi:NADH-quinone oxidoreductase subunit M